MLIGALGALGLAAGTVQAAEYTVYGASSQYPAASIFWLEDSWSTTAVASTSPPSISLYGNNGQLAVHGEQAISTVNAPDGATVTRVAMSLACDSRAGWETGLFYRTSEGDYDDFVPLGDGGWGDSLCYEGEYTASHPVVSSSFLPELDAHGLELRSRCVDSDGCLGTGPGGPGSAMASNVAVTIDDPEPPEIKSVSGVLFSGGTVYSNVSTKFSTYDSESGVKRASLSVDGQEVGSKSGECAVTDVRPCPYSLGGWIFSNTDNLAEGVGHTVVLKVEDYAGNSDTASSVVTITRPPLDPYFTTQPRITLNKVRKQITAGERILLSGSLVHGGAIAYYSGRVHLQLSRNKGRTWKTLRTTRVRPDKTFRAHIRLKLPAKRAAKRGRRSKASASKVWLSVALAKSKTSAEMVARSNVASVTVRKHRRNARGRARK